MQSNETHCADCGAEFKREPDSIGTGYGELCVPPHTRICYACIAIRDRECMRNVGRYTLYLTKSRDGEPAPYVVTNWPGTLRFPVYGVRKGRHNMAGTRTDAWFPFDGHWWHAVNYGEHSEIAHCRRTKERAAN